MSDSDLELVALHAAIEAHASSYKEMADNWRAVDSKAQAVITIAGIFIAGALALARDSEALTSPIVKFGLVTVVLLLVATVLVAASVLRLRDVDGPVAGDDFERMARDLARSADHLSTEPPDGAAVPSATLEVRYARETCALWRRCLETVAQHHDVKARRLFRGQQFLVAAVMAGAALTIVQVVLPWFSSP